MHNNSLIIILGPTGVGKTSVGIKLANALQCSIISSDSRQIYRELKIGTAAPTEEELNAAKHYFIGTLSVDDEYSAGQYELDAIPVIENEIKENGTALLLGGSMLYIDAITKGIDPMPNHDPELREELKQVLANEGIEELRRRLQYFDPELFKTIDLNNHQRIIHAIEMSIISGQPFSSLRSNTVKERSFNIIKIGLNLPREELYARINQRVDNMMSDGLLEEARRFYDKRHINALNTVGYKELFDYFDGTYTLEEAVEKIKKNSRVYAKKQIAWHKRDSSIHWFSSHQIEEIKQFLKINS